MVDCHAPAYGGRTGLTVFLSAFAAYLLTAYGGIRSPDGEVVFRTSLALAHLGSFALDSHSPWTGFGVAPGRDGVSYSVFGPGLALVAAPLAALGDALVRTGRFDESPRSPDSHYADDTLLRRLRGEPPAPDRKPHARRLPAALLNSLLTAGLTWLFFRLAVRLTGSTGAALLSSALLGVGTMLWSYAGTFFSEPLATLLVLASFSQIARPEGTAPALRRTVFFSGLLLGAATTVHLTAILFVPFFLALAVWPVLHPGSGGWTLRPAGAAAFWFGAGLSVFLLLLAWHNQARFGSLFESGRGAEGQKFIYSFFVPPWRGLVGLLASPGKGLFWFCPAVLLGLFSWRRWYRRQPVPAVLVLAAVGFRLVFIAARSDWPGGYSLGPRYLVMALPFLLLPVAFLAADVLRAGRRPAAWGLAALTALCAAQQWYFALGEIFSFTHDIRWAAEMAGRRLLEHHAIYFEWAASPLHGLLEGRRGPFLLQGIPLDNRALWWIGIVLLSAGAWWLTRKILAVGTHGLPSGADGRAGSP